MTGNVSILTVITSDRKDSLIRARKVVVAHEGKSIPGINSDSVPDVVACKHIAAGPEYPVYRIVSRVDGVGQSNGVFVSGYLNVALLEGTHLGCHPSRPGNRDGYVEHINDDRKVVVVGNCQVVL